MASSLAKDPVALLSSTAWCPASVGPSPAASPPHGGDLAGWDGGHGSQPEDGVRCGCDIFGTCVLHTVAGRTNGSRPFSSGADAPRVARHTTNHQHVPKVNNCSQWNFISQNTIKIEQHLKIERTKELHTLNKRNVLQNHVWETHFGFVNQSTQRAKLILLSWAWLPCLLHGSPDKMIKSLFCRRDHC